MGWTVRGLNSGRGEVSRTGPDRPLGPPTTLCNGNRVSLQDVERPGRGVDHPPSFRAEVRERASVVSYRLKLIFTFTSTVRIQNQH